MKMKNGRTWIAAILLGIIACAVTGAAQAQRVTTQTQGATRQTQTRGVVIAAPATTATMTQPVRGLYTGPAPAIAARGTSSTAIQEMMNELATEAQAQAGPAKAGSEKMIFNFRGVPLDTVLDYMSKAAGLIIVRNVSTVQGRVDVVSHTPLNKEEAVQLLNTVLKNSGYGAVLNERTLKIATLDEIRKMDIPVQTGSLAEKLKKTDEMVTQIIPVKYVNATQLIPTLQLLLPTYAVISSNESSNAVILTATTTDIRRMMLIISALDTSISDISMLKVYMLQNADATEVARMIGELYREQSSSSSSRGGFPFGGPGGPMGMMFGGRDGGRDRGGSSSSSGDSVARRAAQRVTATGDSRTNALVVNAPKDVIPTIDQLVEQIDTLPEQILEIRVFTLRYADATMMSQLINDIFQSQQSGGSSRSGGGDFRSMIMQRFMGGSRSSSSGSRLSQQSMVMAVPDIRTNAVVVNADKDLMEQIAPMIQQLDQDPAKDKKVMVYPLKFADAEQTATILQDMFGDGRTNFSSRRNTTGGVFGNSTSSNRNSSSFSRNSSSGGGRTPQGLGGFGN